MPIKTSFLGTGWSFPPAFGPRGAEVHTVTDVEDLEQSLMILLETRRGERVMQDDFGCDLSEFLFGEISQAPAKLPAHRLRHRMGSVTTSTSRCATTSRERASGCASSSSIVPRSISPAMAPAARPIAQMQNRICISGWT